MIKSGGGKFFNSSTRMDTLSSDDGSKQDAGRLDPWTPPLKGRRVCWGIRDKDLCGSCAY